VDLRHPEAAVLDTMHATLGDACEAVAAETGVQVDLECIWYSPPVAFDGGCVGAVRKGAQLLDYGHMDAVSGAGHDAVYVSRVAPTAMVFIPCEGGISHNETENATPADVEAGANVLLHAMLDRAFA
jgi:N-carbamoyl-L-amino-acid hydrolase